MREMAAIKDALRVGGGGQQQMDGGVSGSASEPESVAAWDVEYLMAAAKSARAACAQAAGAAPLEGLRE